EIMYNPLNGSDYEFVEIHNRGPDSSDLSGAYFSEGITYVFSGNTILEAGNHLVLARNRSSFMARYPSVTNLAPGAFTGKLSNGGEALRLKGADGCTLYATEYDNNGGWPEAADGGGASLELIDVVGKPDDPDSWRSSPLFHGSPGRPPALPVPDIVINEVLTHTDLPLEDAIELYNTGTNDVNLGGWYLSDGETNRLKYRIPDNTIMSGRSHVVFYEFQFNAPAQGLNAFALSSGSGDEVFLSEVDTHGVITRYVDEVGFGPAENGVSFGRFPNGTGPLTAMASMTFGTSNPGTVEAFRAGTGASNAMPKIGPVVINEMMYRPPDLPGDVDNDRDEFIELVNITSNAVPLFDPLAPTNTWKLGEAVDFVFPTNIVLQPGEHILVISTNDVDGFRAAWGVSTNVRVFGPWSGKLDNGS
ncbi:MAG: lamin tail domain-containing protein, partial [Verrucomicrobiota bacterium]